MKKEKQTKQKIIEIIEKADMENECRKEWFEEWADEILKLFEKEKKNSFKDGKLNGYLEAMSEIKKRKLKWHAENNLDFEMYKAKWKAEIKERIIREIGEHYKDFKIKDAPDYSVLYLILEDL